MLDQSDGVLSPVSTPTSVLQYEWMILPTSSRQAMEFSPRTFQLKMDKINCCYSSITTRLLKYGGIEQALPLLLPNVVFFFVNKSRCKSERWTGVVVCPRQSAADRPASPSRVSNASTHHLLGTHPSARDTLRRTAATTAPAAASPKSASHPSPPPPSQSSSFPSHAGRHGPVRRAGAPISGATGMPRSSGVGNA